MSRGIRGRLMEETKNIEINQVRHRVWAYIPGASRCFWASCGVYTADGTLEEPTEPLTCVECLAKGF